ncbi:MAG: AtpZ/AtpI family protein [Planctomycetota bacterium]
MNLNGPDLDDPDNGEDSEDRRSATAKAVDISSRLMTISLCLVIPIAGGYYVDQYLETKAVFVVLGLLFGMVASGWQLYKLTAPGGLLSDDRGDGPGEN